MNETNNKDWNQPGTWAEELVEQAKRQAHRYLTIIKILLVIIVLQFAGIVGLSVYNTHMANTFDYIYQNGEGQNNFNNNVGGDVNNVTTDKGQEER